MKRFFDLARKTWLYLLEALQHPIAAPRVFWLVAFRRTHLGGYLKFSRYRRWFESQKIQTVFDVGAHQGEFASVIRAILPAAQIYSFEPQPDCYEKLAERFHGRDHFRSFCVAVGDRQGKTTFWRSSFSKASSVLPMGELHKTSFPWSDKTTPVEVEMNTLDGLAGDLKLEGGVLLKVDVQGFEDRVLRGATETLKRVDLILVETSLKPLYEGQASFHGIYNLLVNAGFEYAGNLDQLESPKDAAILQADALFVRKG